MHYACHLYWVQYFKYTFLILILIIINHLERLKIILFLYIIEIGKLFSYLNCAGGAANKAPPCLEAAREGANPSSF